MSAAVIHLKTPLQILPPNDEYDNTTQVIACDCYNPDERKIVVGMITWYVGDNVALAECGDAQAVENAAGNHVGQDYFIDLRVKP